jgi:hypothetical protein
MKATRQVLADTTGRPVYFLQAIAVFGSADGRFDGDSGVVFSAVGTAGGRAGRFRSAWPDGSAGEAVRYAYGRFAATAMDWLGELPVKVDTLVWVHFAGGRFAVYDERRDVSYWETPLAFGRRLRKDLAAAAAARLGRGPAPSQLLLLSDFDAVTVQARAGVERQRLEGDHPARVGDAVPGRASGPQRAAGPHRPAV